MMGEVLVQFPALRVRAIRSPSFILLKQHIRSYNYCPWCGYWGQTSCGLGVVDLLSREWTVL